MSGKLACWWFFSVILVFNKFSLILSEDEYETITTVISLTGSAQPFAYIEAQCKDSNDSSTCRSFTCSSFSKEPTEVFWYFKCLNDTCEYEHKPAESEAIGLQTLTNITLERLQAGYLKCVANNSDGEVEAFQDVVPINNKGQRFIVLNEEDLEFDFSPDGNDLFVQWYISVQGHPSPNLNLLRNGTPLFDLWEKYKDVKTSYNAISLNITNVSGIDLETKFQLFAYNVYENKTLNLRFNATDIKMKAITVSSLDETGATLKCTAASLLPTNISWFYKPCLDSNCSYNSLVENYSEVNGSVYTSYLKVNSTMKGYLMCNTTNGNHSYSLYQAVEDLGKDFDIFGVEDIEEIDNLTKILYVERSQTVNLSCAASAFNYTDDLKWTYFGVNKQERANIEQSKTRNSVFSYQKNLTLSDLNLFGTFYCKAMTKNGTVVLKKIQITEKVFKLTYYIIGVLLLLVAAISVFILIKMRTYRKLQKEMKELNSVGLANFEKGALEHLNPNLTIDNQADLLPYDKKYEFPIEDLKLGEQIGSGAFGVVVKGEAKGVFENEPTTTVAVKMVNRNIGDIYIKALASELKIMIHLGKHVNVVNLLGACTKNITKRELLVIVEYCRFGNLKDYLLNHRNTFIDQINAETGQIDFSIGTDKLGSNDPLFTYVTPSFASRLYQSQISTSQPSEAGSEEDTNVNYKGDYQGITKPVCTRDLLLWSFQVARGMEYLSSRNVLHGDLAARNILLTDGNVVKICDFGLSKKVYQNDIYKKAGDEMLPVKWMAIEAITDKIFSVQSDIWSYGIVLWELFSLARTPYPGMEYNEDFCEKLLEGYRMKCPQFATQEIYDIMLKCWDCDPSCRPTFSQLVNKLGSVLDEQMREHYIDMNTGYLKMNAQRFKEKNTDYLSMVGAPNFQQFSSPYRYINLDKKSSEETNTYL